MRASRVFWLTAASLAVTAVYALLYAVRMNQDSVLYTVGWLGLGAAGAVGGLGAFVAQRVAALRVAYDQLASSWEQLRAVNAQLERAETELGQAIAASYAENQPELHDA
jgi:hypothetical protein